MEPGPEKVGPGMIQTEQSYTEEVHRYLRRNYIAHLLHGLLGQTGFRLVNAPTLIPAYVLMLSGSEFVVGLTRSLQFLGMFLSPLLGASLIEHRKKVLGVGLWVGASMRFQILGIALAGLLLSPKYAVIAIGLFLFLFGFLIGIQGVIFNFLLSKVIPVAKRGRLLGLRNALAGATAAAVAYWGGQHLLDINALGNGYAATFLVAFGLTSVGLSMLFFVHEPSPPHVRPPTQLRDRIRELPSLLRADRAFTHYFLSRALATMGRMATPFYIIHAQEVIGLTGSSIGLLTATFIASNSIGNLAWGAMADRTGFRKVFIASIVLWALSVVGIMASESLVDFVWAFIGIGTGMGGFQMAAQNMVLEFGDREDLPMRIAVANSAQEGVGALGPLIGGVIAVMAGLNTLYIVSIAFQVLAILMVLFWVDEPRNRKA
ncbi:MAG: MFS transporter [Myxococcota bacterium]|nr:MAG: MFS transporter [Proteobacteria bacterium TMED72]